jgi:hypothetical protein
MPLSMQSIFREHFEGYAQQRRLSVRELRAADAIRCCRTPALGGQLLRCEQGHSEQIRYFSCRHRSCPRCTALPRQQWAQAQSEKLLPCEHLHLVFTLPHELLGLWAYNRSRLAALLFDAVRQTLLQLCADPRWLGVTPGLLLALHTWGRTLNAHPHLHVLLSAGGLDAHGQWRPAPPRFVLPIRVIKSFYRGKLLGLISAAVRSGRLVLPPALTPPHWRGLLRALYRKNFNVHLGSRYAHGEGVVRYLARYVKGGPLREQRLQRGADDQIGFDYTDHRDGGHKRCTLAPHAFIARVLWHAPPGHLHTVRHAGLYASAARERRLQCRAAIEAAHTSPRPRLPAPAPAVILKPSCTHCQQPLRHVATLPPAHRFGEFSNRRRGLTPRQLNPAQLGVEADAPTRLHPRAPPMSTPTPPAAPSGALLI